jgi:hypothetical protein
MTENRFALYLAHNYSVKFENQDIPFAKDIDFITNKFWFKLKKGFSDSTRCQHHLMWLLKRRLSFLHT